MKAENMKVKSEETAAVFTKDSLKIDAAKVTAELCQVIAEQIGVQMKKRGAVIGISGGID